MIITTDYSLFNSSIKLNKAIELSSSNGFLILADRNLNAVPKFVFSCRKNNIKPIVSVLHSTERAEYLFIALNENGFKELLYFETKGYTSSIFKSPNIMVVLNDIYDIENFYLPKYAFLRNSKYEGSLEDKYNKFIRNIEGLKILSPMIINSENESDHFLVSALRAVGEKRYMEELSFSTYTNFNHGYNDEFFLSVVEKIEDYFQFGNPCPPEFKFKKEVAIKEGLELEGLTDEKLFEYLVFKGGKKRFKGKEIPKEYVDRAKYEIDIINRMKFPGYFLIVWDFINYAKENNIPVGPGRGSAAGALIAWLLEITDIDPIPNGLLFERFLNPDRVSFPDIDIDFCQNRRQEVIDYVVKKYGEDSVAQVITFGTMGVKGAIKDSARIQQVPDVVANKMSKEIPEKPGIDFKTVYSSNASFWDKWKSEDYYVAKTWDLAVRMEGFNRNHGTHAAAVVISNQPIFEKAPVYEIGGTKDNKGTMAIGYEGKYLEDADLIKYDFLGLKTLTVIDFTLKNIKEAHGKIIDLSEITKDDENIYNYISLGETRGLFQIESEGMKDLAQRLKPSNFEDITAMLALHRPGPMEAGMLDSFVERKHGREEISYFFDSMEKILKPILEPTYGMIVYQEQVMQIVRGIAGFSLGESDLVRRAMGKKDTEEMDRVKKNFVKGAVENGYDEKDAAELFSLIEKFAGYGFNKSHSAAYAQITYYTAFLKYYYPAEFMTALIQLEINSSKNLDKVAFYIEEAKNMGIEVVPPNIETSSLEFKTFNGKIYFGLKGINGVGDGAIDLVEAYNNYFNGDVKQFLWNLQSDHTGNLKKLEKKKETLLNRIEKAKERVEKNNLTLDKKISSKENKIVDIKNKIELLKDKNLVEGTFDYEVMSERDKDRLDKMQNTIVDLESELMILKNPEARNFKSIEQLEKYEVELKEINREIEYLEKNKIDMPKIKKSDFEGLAAVGALSVLGMSRKFMIENINELLNPKKVLDLDFSSSNIEYFKSELIPLEMKYLHFILIDPFEGKISEYNSLELPEDVYVITVLSKVEKRKKDGGSYTSVQVKTTRNEIFELNDFQNKLSNKNIGDVVLATIKKNGKYYNLKQVSSVKNIFDNFSKKKKTISISVFDDIPDNLSEYDIVEVKDGEDYIMTMFKN